MRETKGKRIVCFLLYLLIVFCLTLAVVRYVGQRTLVKGSSMEPTLSDGDNLIVDKISYRFHDPKRFEIVVFPYEYEENTFFIKRIIGLPGEKVRIDESGRIYINGQELIESYGREVIKDPGIAVAEQQLGDDEYFVLGDNRNNSTDSRDERVGFVARKELVGRTWFRIYPFDQMGLVHTKE